MQARSVIEMYSELDGTQLQIEGPHHMQDLSYSFVNSCEPMKRVEQGIFFHPHLLMNHDELRKTDDGR